MLNVTKLLTDLSENHHGSLLSHWFGQSESLDKGAPSSSKIATMVASQQDAPAQQLTVEETLICPSTKVESNIRRRDMD